MSGPPSTVASFSQRSNRRLPPLRHSDSRDIADARLSGDTQRPSLDGASASLHESPITFSTESARPGPGPGNLRSRKTKSPTTATPIYAQSIDQQLTRSQKQVADKSVTKALQRSILHVLPVLMTSVLFVISAGEVYMSDLDGFSGQAVALQALQFVVKAHEILMTMSLGDIVLHRIRWDLIVKSGVPFGLLSAAYQLGDLGYLFSTEFRSSVWRPRSHDPSFARLTLTFLVLTSGLLCLVVGPSSRVLLIPKLAWWPLKGHSDTLLCVHSFPTALKNYRGQILLDPLPYYGCGNSWLCPGYGAGTIGTWAGSLMFDDASGQIPFIDGGDNFYRWLMSNATDFDGWTAATSPMMVMSTLIGQYWNWVSYEAFVDDGVIQQPLVQVQCSVQYANESQSELSLPHDQLVSTQKDAYSNLTWPIYSNYSNANISACYNNLCWARLPLDNHVNPPTEGLIFVLTDEYENKATVPCSLVAHWVRSDISVYPKTDRNIHSDPNSNPNTVAHRSDINLSPAIQLTFSNEWWNMSFPNGSTAMEDMIHGVSLGAGDDGLQLYHAGSQGFAYRISTIVGMFFADALARYGFTGTVTVVSQDPHNGSQPFVQNTEFFYLPHEEVPAGFSSWVEYAETSADGWREATVIVKRYGYAWSFSGVLTKFAGLALLAHSLLAIGHIAMVLSGRWSSSAWDSIGNMLALALRSRSSAVPPDHRTGDEKEKTWAETVSVRLVENDLELVFNPRRAETLRLMQR